MADSNELSESLQTYLEETTAQVPIKYVKVRGKTHRLHGIKVFEHIETIRKYESTTGKEFDDQDVAGAEALKEVDESITTTINTVVNPKLEQQSQKIASLETSFSNALTNLKNTPIAKAVGATGTTFTAVINVLNNIVNRGTLSWNPSSSTSKTIPAGYYSGGTISTSNAYSAGSSAGYSSGYSSGYSAGQSAGVSAGRPLYVAGFGRSIKGSNYPLSLSVSGTIVAVIGFSGFSDTTAPGSSNYGVAFVSNGTMYTWGDSGLTPTSISSDGTATFSTAYKGYSNVGRFLILYR